MLLLDLSDELLKGTFINDLKEDIQAEIVMGPSTFNQVMEMA